MPTDSGGKSTTRRSEPVPLIDWNRPEEKDGVVFANVGSEKIETQIICLHALRQYWQGPVMVMHWGRASDALRIACTRLGIVLRHVNENIWPDFGDYDALRDASRLCPFRRTLVLLPGMLVVGPLDELLNSQAAGLTRCGSTPRKVVGRIPSGQSCLEIVESARAESYSGKAADDSIVDFSTEPEKWTETAWELWSQHEAKTSLYHAPLIRVASDATIVTVVTQESFRKFQRNFLTWRFPPGTPLYLLFAGMRYEELWIPGRPAGAHSIEISLASVNDSATLLSIITNHCKTGRCIILPAVASASPGAELWNREPQDAGDAIVHSTEESHSEEAITGNMFVPDKLFGMFRISFLRHLVTMPEASAADFGDLARALKAMPGPVRWMDMAKHGWKVPCTHIYCGKSRARNTPKAVPSDSAAPYRPSSDDENLPDELAMDVADDVVVINLPERSDRRKGIVKMMGEKNLRFRFVDGVKVSPEDIRSEEIAEVGFEAFKVAAGREKYLCGMVGCKRAHEACLEYAFSRKLKSILIVEDDAALIDGWYSAFGLCSARTAKRLASTVSLGS